MKEVYEKASIEWISFDRFQLVYSISLFFSGIVLHFSQGFKRLIVLIPLSIFFIFIVQWTIINGLFFSKIPVYVLIVVCVFVILFHDCSELDQFDN